MFKSHVTFTINNIFTPYFFSVFTYAVKIPESTIVEHEGFKKPFSMV